MAIFLDIRGAFDNLDTEAAIVAMRDRNMPEWYIQWYQSFLLNRVVTCTINDTTQKREIKRGSPQGGIGSPQFWNVPFDELLEIINTGPFVGIGFADDGALIIHGQNLEYMRRLLQKSINIADSSSEW